MHLKGLLRMFAVAGVLAGICTAAMAEDTGPIIYTDDGTHVLTVQSSVEQSGALYSYDYYLENDSLIWNIVNWTWSSDGNTYNVMPNPSATVEDGSYEWPIPYSLTPNWEDLTWRGESFFDPRAPMQVTSIIYFDDGYSFEVPIYVPQVATAAVPEPSTLLALCAGIMGIMGHRKKLI